MNSFLNIYTELVISKHYESKKNGHGHPVFLHLHKLLILKKNSKRQMFYFKVFILKDMHVESFTWMLQKKKSLNLQIIDGWGVNECICLKTKKGQTMTIKRIFRSDFISLNFGLALVANGRTCFHWWYTGGFLCKSYVRWLLVVCAHHQHIYLTSCVHHLLMVGAPNKHDFYFKR